MYCSCCILEPSESRDAYMCLCISDIRHLGTCADMRNNARFELRMQHNFVALNGHLPIYCFLGISLVLNNIFCHEIEHLSRTYAVTRFNSGQQQYPTISNTLVPSVNILNSSLNYHNCHKIASKSLSCTDNVPDSNSTGGAAKMGNENCCCYIDSKQSACN